MPKTIFKTGKKEDFNTRKKRWFFNFFPAYRRSGGRVVFIAEDFKEVHVSLGLNWKTKNYVGTVFGGSIYAAVDPIYMAQLLNILGKDFVVWDKAASIKFIKPIRNKVHANFIITEELLAEIKTNVAQDQKYVFDITTTFQDEAGVVYAEIVKTIYVADKEFYKQRKKS